MSNAQKKINLNQILSSDGKNNLNDKLKGRNINSKTFIKRIKGNSTEKFDFSVIKNNNYTTQHQNLTNSNNQNFNFQPTNYIKKDNINDRYSATLLDKKIQEKRPKSGLATSLSSLEILRKNQESRLTNAQDSKIPNSNETNPSTSSNKIDIKISFNYSKNNSLNKNNNIYTNYYLKQKNLSKPNFSNVNTSNNYEYLNTHSNNGNSSINKTNLLNTSAISKPMVLQNNVNLNDNENIKNLKIKNNQNQNFRKIKNENDNNELNTESSENNKRNQSETHFYQNNLNFSLNNLENKPIITNYYAKSKGNYNSFAFNQNMIDKINNISNFTGKNQDYSKEISESKFFF